MSYKGEIGQFDYEKQPDGTFLYKAKENAVISKPKTAKPQYKERPQYPVIEQYEQKAVERYQEDIKTTAKQVIQFLNTI